MEEFRPARGAALGWVLNPLRLKLLPARRCLDFSRLAHNRGGGRGDAPDPSHFPE